MKQTEFIELLLSEYGGKSPLLETEPAEDDCSVLQFGNQYLIATTDRTKTPPLAFELGIEDYRSWGRYLAAANISDIIGSGGVAIGLLVNITVPETLKHHHLRSIAKGVAEYTEAYGCPVIGGDTKPGSEVVLSGTALGKANERSELRLRSGARPGDLIIVSGTIGDCYASAVAYSTLDESQYDREFVQKSILDPGLPKEQNDILRQTDCGNGGIDISDGFGGDLRRLAGDSGVGVEVWSEEIPLSNQVVQIAEALGQDPIEFAFGFGGDWEFIATVDRSIADNILENFYVVGEITEEESYEIISGEESKNLPSDAYDGFNHKDIIDMF